MADEQSGGVGGDGLGGEQGSEAEDAPEPTPEPEPEPETNEEEEPGNEPSPSGSGARFETSTTTPGAFAGQTMEPTLRPFYLFGDPILEFQYVFIWRVLPVAVVTEISGLNEERDVIEHKYVDKNFNPVTQMVPGRIKWDPVVLKRPLMADISLYHWFKSLSLNKGQINQGLKTVSAKIGKSVSMPISPYRAARSNCTIIGYNREYIPSIAWNLINAWPSKITGPTFKSDSSNFAFEEVTIVHEGAYRIDVGMLTAFL